MRPPQEMVYTIYTLVTLSYRWTETPRNVTGGNTYTELQRFTRKPEPTIGKANWTGYGAEYIVTTSKANNQRDK